MVYTLDNDTLALMRQRWRSLHHVGEAKPFFKGWVRTGKLHRQFDQVGQSEVYAHIPGWEGSNVIWQGHWRARNAWKELPRLFNFSSQQSFGDHNGCQVGTIVMDNIGLNVETGVAGIYRQIERGHYSPYLGYRAPFRGQAAGTKNEWYDLLNDESTEIIVVAGYGEDTAVPIFKGTLDQNSLVSRPDTMTITARDHGKFITDQYCFSNAKARHVVDPITFADRREADNTDDVRGGVRASSSAPGHPPKLAVDKSDKSHWLSEVHVSATPNEPEWFEMSIRAGRYESIKLDPQFSGMDCYITIKARDRNAPGGHGAQRDYTHPLRDNEWIDEGKGNVPGTTVPYVHHIPNLKAKNREHWFPLYGYLLGDDSVIRLYFTKLGNSFENKQRRYRAGIADFAVVQRRVTKQAKKANWILVDDAADVVRTVFQWCGFTEWEVEDTGVRLSRPIIFNRSNFLIDIVNRICELTNYVFYMKPPEIFDADDLSPDNETNLSMGIPVFRQNQAMRHPRQVLDPLESVKETDLLQGIQVTIDPTVLAYIIRVRGRRHKRRKGGRRLGGELIPRYMYVYRPPWSRNPAFPDGTGKDDFGGGNLKRYEVHHDEHLSSDEEVKIAALFIAYRMALESVKGQCEFPWFPTILLDNQMAVKDTGTGLSTRIYVTNRNVTLQAGEDGSAKASIGGSLIDFPDIVVVREELIQALRDHNYDPGLDSREIRRRHTTPEYGPPLN